jgi:haloalkane dehalogenase
LKTQRYPAKTQKKQKKIVTLSEAYPFESHYVTANNIRLHYVDEGPADGKPLLFLHGNPTWSYLYRNIIPPLAATGYRVLAMDNMGFGRSDKPLDVEAHTIQRHVANLQGFIESLGLQQVTFVGHAWGAVFSLAYAAQKAENVSALVLLNGDTYLAIKLPGLFKILFIWPITSALLARRLNVSARLLLQRGTYYRQHLNAAIMARYINVFSDYTARAGVLGLPRMLPLKQNHPSSEFLRKLEGQLPSFKMPVLLIAGAHDPGSGVVAMRRLQQMLPHAEMHTMEHAGHFMQEDAPEEIVFLIQEFLKQHFT